MYFTRKKTTVNATLFHLDDMTDKQKHDHLIEVYKMANSSFSSLTNPTSKLPIHFIVPIIFDEGASDDSIFSSQNKTVLTDVLGLNTYTSVCFPKVVIDKLFSERASLLLKDYKIEKENLKKSVFTRPTSTVKIPLAVSFKREIPLEGFYKDSYQSSSKHLENYHKFIREYSISNNYGRSHLDKDAKIDESKLVAKLNKESGKQIKSKTRMNKLFVIDYNLSLSELGEFIVTILKVFKKNRGRYIERIGENISYGSTFISTMYDILRYTEGSLSFISLLCDRLGIKDDSVKVNLNKYVSKRMGTVYDDTLSYTNDYHLRKESTMETNETITNINNTFVPITFFIYLTTHNDLFNKPTETVKYFHALTGTSSLQGAISYFNDNTIQDNYYDDSFTTTIVTTILPVNFTDFVLKSKMSDLKSKQLFMEVPGTNLLSTEYNLLYNDNYNRDFIFYNDDKIGEITKELSSLINVRFDKNIKVLYFPYIPTQYPLSMHSYSSHTYRTYEMHMKEIMFEYLGIDIQYNQSIQESINKVKSILNSFKILNTITKSLIPKDIEDYLYAWLIMLYLHNNILFRYDFYDFKNKLTHWYNEEIDVQRELSGGWRYDFLHNEYSKYGDYSRVVAIYPTLLEVVYKMIQQSNVEIVLTALKETILPEVNKEAKALVSSITTLYKTKETIVSWEDFDKRDRRESESTFNKIEHLVYEQYNIRLSSIIGNSLSKNNYEKLLTHFLTYAKVFHYFRSLRSTFYPLLEYSMPKLYIKDNWKTLNNVGNEGGSLFELKQLIIQRRAKYPKVKDEEYCCEELYKWYEEMHLNLLIETF